MKLRSYQQEAVEEVYRFLETKPGAPVVVIPTGGGKTPVIATLARDVCQQWGGRVLILAHVKELLVQAYEKIRDFAPDLRVGLYSAGLGQKVGHHPCTVAGIQSIHKKAEQFEPFDLVIVDECHLIPRAGDGMYRTFIEALRRKNPEMKVVGLTATPFRLDSGAICSEDGILTEICYSVAIGDLIEQGYLSRLRSFAAKAQANLSEVHIRGGEYVEAEMEAAFNQSELIEKAVDELLLKTEDRRSILIFAAGVDHCKTVAECLQGKIAPGDRVAVVTGSTPSPERAQILADFKAKKIRYLVNVNVLTTGFDAPNVDAIALMRSTMSAGLYVQILGRGSRLAEGKEDCLILDYGGNIKRHGPIDLVKIKEAGEGEGAGAPLTRECPDCGAVLPILTNPCHECGHEWPKEEGKPKHGATSDPSRVIAQGKEQVTHTTYGFHRKKSDPNARPVLRVTHYFGLVDKVDEWVCLEHDGWAGEKARQWWLARSNYPTPRSVQEAVDAIGDYESAIAKTLEVTIKPDGDFVRIVTAKVGPRPPWPPGFRHPNHRTDDDGESIRKVGPSGIVVEEGHNWEDDTPF